GCAGLFQDGRSAGHVLGPCRPVAPLPRSIKVCDPKAMKTVVVDKIASITQALNLGHELRVATTDIPCEEGVVLVAEILTNKSTYNTLELTSGRMAKLAKRDIIVGALGHRQALFGYSGHLPQSVKAGGIIQVLSIGGVLGVVESVNPEKGRPFDARVIGVVLLFPYL